MLKNHLKTAIRNLFRHKLNAFIIILSLTVAFSFSNILLSFVVRELNTDGFHKHKNRIYRLHSNNPFDEGEPLWSISREIINVIETQFPEVEAITTIHKHYHKGVGLEEELNEDVEVLDIDTSFFSFFNYSIIEGNPNTLIQLDDIVLTESTAQKMLKGRPYIGQTVEMALTDTTSRLLTVTAIVADPLENTQIKFDALALNSEKSQHATAYLLLSPNTDVESLVAKINQNKDIPGYFGPEFRSTYELTSLQDTYFVSDKGVWNFEPSRSKLLIWICWGVVFLISTAASFNFINLFIISLMNRKKAMGVRKVLGATSATLGLGFGIEVGLYMVIALVLSAIFTLQILPWFNLSFDTSLTFAYLLDKKVLLIVGSQILLLGLLITIYLVYFSWRLSPIVLLGNQVAKKIRINRFLVGAQFFITMGMMICAVIVIGQMQFIKNSPLGFNRDLMRIYALDEQKLNVLKQKLLQYPEFSSIALSSGDPIYRNHMVQYRLDDGTFYKAYFMTGDYDLIKTMQLEIIEGQSFGPGLEKGKLVNEAFVRHFNMENPVGATIPTAGNKIIGVVKDFHVYSFKEDIPPYIISYQEKGDNLLIDISGKKLSTLLPIIEKNWKEIYPNETFRYDLINDELMAKHQEDTLFFRMIISFTIASVLISCFGLFGIAAFTAVQRTKEIGIRKVLGASVSGILVLLSKDFVKLIIIAFIFAIPFANYFMSEWLQNFAYKIEINWWMFAIPGLLVLGIALLSMLGQTLKAAHANPVDSLRNE